MATEKTNPTEPATPAPAAAPVDFANMPGFAEAVATAARAVAEQSQATMLATMQAIVAGSSRGGDMKDTISELTAAIVGMQDPKNEARRITPAEAEKRAAAFSRMGELITSMQKDGKTAKYQVVHKAFLSDVLLEPVLPIGNGQWADNIIYWNAAPGPGLSPLDDTAKAIYEQYLIYIGGSTKNQAGVVEQPLWAHGNLVMSGTPSQTAQARGGIKSIEPMAIDSMALSGTSVKSTSDRPGEKTVRVLGSLAEPARVTEAGNIPSAHIS